MNAIIYCRVSSKEQVDGTSLESQELACLEYASRNSLNVVRVFVERGESAKFADRTQLLELLAFCGERKERIEQLLVWKVDRLARNVGDHFNIKATLLKLGVRVVSVTEPIDAKPEGKLLETILAGFAQFDNDIRAARTVQGMRRKIQEGIFPWQPPLGYKGAAQAGSKKTEPDVPAEPAFGILRQAWQELATGAYTKAQIRRMLGERGLHNREGNPLSSQIVDHIFSDPFYAGVIVDPWSMEEHTGKHLAMVSRETFAIVQRVILGRNRSLPHRGLRPEFPLRSFARCSNCEESLTGSFSRGRSRIYPYYHCNRRSCDLHGYYALDEVHEEYAQFLYEVSPNRHALSHLREHIRSIAEAWKSQHATLAEKRIADRKQAEAELQQLIRMKMADLITDNEFRAQRRILSERLMEGNTNSGTPAIDPDSVLHDLDLIAKPLTRLADTWRAVPIEFQKRFQHLTLPNGYVVGSVGTASKGHILSFFEASLPADTNQVPPVGESWNQLMSEIISLASIFKELPDAN